jgi:hypothetical protein
MQMATFWSKGFRTMRCLKVILIGLFPVMLRLLPLEWIKNQNSICLIKNITGHECWGCGMTRAVLSAINFEFTDALTYNKLVIIVLPILFWIWAKYLVESWHLMKVTSG